tara:strand:+ start:355 stop:864 length:510 start_codon:yes stop_codon:yes gene_type:complete
MEQKLDNKIEIKDRLTSFYKINKLKIYLLTTFLLMIIIALFFFQINVKKKNIYIAEKYVEAGLYLATNDIENSKKIYEEIILSKNKFYSILALNTILEKDLESNRDVVLKYFESLEKLNKSKEQTDLIIFKKALYLIKISNIEEGNKLFKKLIDENSKYKNLAEEIISK